MSELIFTIDQYFLGAIGQLKNPVLDFSIPLLTSLGNGGILWILMSIGLLCFKTTRKCGFAMSIALILVLIFGNILLKPLIARSRPFMVDETINLLITPPTDFSFPSGHTYSAVAGAFVICHHYKKWGIAIWCLAIVIAFSRMYLMVHYFTDVIGGIVLGILCGYIAVKITQLLYKRRRS